MKIGVSSAITDGYRKKKEFARIKKSRRFGLRIVMILCVAFFLVSLAGCDLSALKGVEYKWHQSNNSGKTDNDNKETVTIALWDYGVVSYDQALIEEFERQNPDLKVDVLSFPNQDYDQQLTVSIAGQEDIDIMYFRSPWQYYTFAFNNYIYALDEFLDESLHDLEKSSVWVRESQEINGKIYGLPYRYDTLVLYYNKTIFDDCGLDYPDMNLTWQNLEMLAKELSKGSSDESRIYGLGLVSYNYLLNDFWKQYTKLDLANYDIDYLREPLSIYYRMQNEDHSVTDYAQIKARGIDQLGFIKGNWAMMINGSWFVEMLLNYQDSYDFEWGIVRMPVWENTQLESYMMPTPVSMASYSNNKTNAWRLLSYISSKEAAEILSAHGVMPAYRDKSIYNIYENATNLDNNSLEAIFEISTARERIVADNNHLISNIINSEVDYLFLNYQTLDETLENIMSRREKLLDIEKQ